MELAVSVTVTMTGEDGTAVPVSGELAAALAAPAEQFASMLSWAARDAGSADHGDREAEIAMSGRELQRQLLEATFTINAGCEERVEQVTSAAGGGRGRGAAAARRPAEQFAGLAAWAAGEARYLDHGERETVIGEEGRELQRRLLQARSTSMPPASSGPQGSPAPRGSGTAPWRKAMTGA